jgi:hypothetical protein
VLATDTYGEDAYSIIQHWEGRWVRDSHLLQWRTWHEKQLKYDGLLDGCQPAAALYAISQHADGFVLVPVEVVRTEQQELGSDAAAAAAAAVQPAELAQQLQRALATAAASTEEAAAAAAAPTDTQAPVEAAVAVAANPNQMIVPDSYSQLLQVLQDLDKQILKQLQKMQKKMKKQQQQPQQQQQPDAKQYMKLYNMLQAACSAAAGSVEQQQSSECVPVLYLQSWGKV